MIKKTAIGIVSAGILVLGITGANNSPKQSSVNTKPVSSVESKTVKSEPAKKVSPICDGTTITANCTVEGVSYSSYVYHPAVQEKSHVITDTTYDKKVTGYCTLCNDQTYSPSCATGRGACSYHGGVAQWNAPVYSNTAINTPRTVIDAPAVEAYYDKIAD